MHTYKILRTNRYKNAQKCVQRCSQHIDNESCCNVNEKLVSLKKSTSNIYFFIRKTSIFFSFSILFGASKFSASRH